MKKSDIIDTYNNLLPELKREAQKYTAVTGKNYKDKFGFHIFNNMDPRHMLYTKDDLERMLHNRQRHIQIFIDATQDFINVEEMKSTESGIKFIKGLEERKKVLNDKLSEISCQFVSSFNKLLHSVGLTNWEILNGEIPSFSPLYSEIYYTNDGYYRLRCNIFCKDKWFKMELGSSVSGTVDITKKDKDHQYQQFKAYVTIFDNCEVFTKWLNTEYREMASKVDEIHNELCKIEDTLENPYDAWMKSK